MSISGLKTRFLIVFLVLTITWTAVVYTSGAQLFPCKTFAYDSDQGYYPSLCALQDEDDEHFVWQQDENGYYSEPTWLTYPALALILLGFPLFDSLIITLIWNRFKKKLSTTESP